MSLIRGKNTKPELALRRLLHEMGYRFRLHRKGLPGHPDIVLPKYRTVIFVHGCFWHQHRGCKEGQLPKSRVDFWKAKLEGNVMRDIKVHNELLKAGWVTVVVWQCELERNFSAVARRLKRILKA